MAEKLAERLLSVKEFLEWESKQPFRHELIGGRVIEMTGASPSHNRINLNLAFALENRLESRGCEVFAIDIGVLVDLEGTYVYPDVIVVCGEQKFRTGALQTTLENPTLLFEILSPTTESFDRNQKYMQYLQIPSLEGYFLVAQDRPRIEAAIRDGDTWRHRVFFRPGGQSGHLVAWLRASAQRGLPAGALRGRRSRVAGKTALSSIQH